MAPASKLKTHEFRSLPYYVWRVVPDPKKSRQKHERPFLILVVTFEQLRHWIYTVPYNSLKQTGWQRQASQSHVNTIAGDMLADRYTPTGWVVSADEWHVKNLVKEDVPENSLPLFTLVVNDNHKLRLVDGNHRFESLLKLLKAAEEEGDVEAISLIKSTAIDVKVLLNPEHIQTDFIRLQKGKSVAINLIKTLEFESGEMSPERLKIMKYATKLARILNETQDSHLYHNVAFGEQTGNIKYSSLIADHASSLATTLYGGAMIGLKLGKSPEWMVKRYVEAYKTLGEYTDHIEIDGEKKKFSVLYVENRKLHPANQGGSKSGSHMLIGVGNALAWRLGILEYEDEDLDGDEKEWFKEVGCRIFEHGHSTGAASEKREDMNIFASAYFKDKEEDPNFEMFDGIPVELINTTSVSTWGVKPKPFREWLKKTKNASDGVEVDEEEEVEEAPKKRRGRPKTRTEYEPEQVLGGVE